MHAFIGSAYEIFNTTVTSQRAREQPPGLAAHWAPGHPAPCAASHPHDEIPALSALNRQRGVDLLAEVQHTAELLWTSASTFEGMGDHDKEFCSLLNAAIQSDHAELAPPAAALARGINAMCVEGRGGAALPFPPGGITYRGGGFNDDHRGFFTEGKVFRQPFFLADILFSGDG